METVGWITHHGWTAQAHGHLATLKVRSIAGGETKVAHHFDLAPPPEKDRAARAPNEYAWLHKGKLDFRVELRASGEVLHALAEVSCGAKTRWEEVEVSRSGDVLSASARPRRAARAPDRTSKRFDLESFVQSTPLPLGFRPGRTQTRGRLELVVADPHAGGPNREPAHDTCGFLADDHPAKFVAIAWDGASARILKPPAGWVPHGLHRLSWVELDGDGEIVAVLRGPSSGALFVCREERWEVASPTFRFESADKGGCRVTRQGGTVLLCSRRGAEGSPTQPWELGVAELCGEGVWIHRDGRTRELPAPPDGRFTHVEPCLVGGGRGVLRIHTTTIERTAAGRIASAGVHLIELYDVESGSSATIHADEPALPGLDASSSALLPRDVLVF